MTDDIPPLSFLAIAPDHDRQKSVGGENCFAKKIFTINSAPLPMKNIVYFDLETQKSAEEVGGWHRIRDMRMSIGVTYSTARGEYKIYGERQVNELIDELRRADL